MKIVSYFRLGEVSHTYNYSYSGIGRRIKVPVQPGQKQEILPEK
jgi:hypothetical protein